MHREGHGVPVNPAESVRLLRISTGFGDPVSRNDLGEALSRGIGVERDAKAAFALFDTAAMQGHVEAQYNLALAYLDGIGVEQDKLMGHAWLRICTSQTFREAIKERGRRRGDLSAEEMQEIRRLEKEIASQLPPFETIANTRLRF
jgi:TPR repeat protein